MAHEKAIDPGAPYAAIAQDLRNLRDDAGLTSAELAKGTTYTASAISHALNGKRLPSKAIIEAIARACNADPSEWQRRRRDAQRQGQRRTPTTPPTLVQPPRATPAPRTERNPVHRDDVAMNAAEASGQGDITAQQRRVRWILRPAQAAPSPRRDGPEPFAEAFAHALHRGEVQAIYQPVVDPVSGRIAVMELLARWTHQGEAVRPATFITACAAAGLSSQLTALMLEQGCAQLGIWNAGLAHRRLRIAVNVDPTEFGDSGLPDRVAGVLRRYRISPDQLVLEMTEGAVNERPADAVDVMHRLRELGVRIALDNFGAGYSTLARLARTPLDSLKIDRSFVTHIDHDEHQRWLLRGLLDLARHLGLETVAKGVDRVGQLHELRRQGCDLVQGHFIARPATGPQLTPALLADIPILAPHWRGMRPPG
jgi:diguanylate cyclase